VFSKAFQIEYLIPKPEMDGKLSSDIIFSSCGYHVTMA